MRKMAALKMGSLLYRDLIYTRRHNTPAKIGWQGTASEK